MSECDSESDSENESESESENERVPHGSLTYLCYELCIMSCVVCVVYYVFCTVHCVLCIMYVILCIMYCVQCILSFSYLGRRQLLPNGVARGSHFQEKRNQIKPKLHSQK